MSREDNLLEQLVSEDVNFACLLRQKATTTFQNDMYAHCSIKVEKIC